MVDETPWYYLEAGETRGPFRLAEMLRLRARGAIAAETPVARAGWNAWRTAAEALPREAPTTTPAPVLSPPPATASMAVELRCVLGPDAGRSFWIGATEVQLDSLSGLSDPTIGELRARLEGDRVRLRVVSGPPLGIAGGASSEAALTHGERVRLGASTWQVGAAEVRVSDLISGLGDRISRLASVERLEGFSLREMFSEVLAKRTQEEIDEYFLVGTARTTPAITEVETGWPRPWLFGRILLFLGLVYFGFFAAVQQFGNPRLLPGLILMGSIAVPFTTLILFYELNTPRNVSFRRVLSLFFTGGVVSLFVSLVGFGLADLSWLGASSAGIVEEIGKLLTVILIVRETKYRYQLNGLLFGAAVGAGFAAFESAGYAFWDALVTVGTLEATARLILVRGLLSPFGHVAWTAIAAASLWRVRRDRPFEVSMLFDPGFLKAFCIPVVLHMLWNSPIPSPFWIKHLVLGAIGWFVLFGLVQQGLRQVRADQLAAAERQLERTQSSLRVVV